MAGSPQVRPGIHTNRFRAAKACRRCNQRRIKCDAIEHGIPCSRCRQNDIGDCVLLESKRGTYIRKKAKANHTSSTPTDPVALPSPTAIEPPSLIALDASCETALLVTEPSLQVEEDLENSYPWAGSPSAAPNPPAATSKSPSEAPAPTAAISTDLESPEANFTETNASSYREISWTAMFEHFLETRRRDRKDIIDKYSITYLGESFPLAIVLGDFKEGGKSRLHHPGPPLEENRSIIEQSNQQVHPAHILPEDLNFLQAKQAFDYPAPEILASLISTFLDRVFPLYPIVNRQDFLSQYQNKNIPWILLHALCFVGATYSPISVLHRAGFTGRKQARFSYYRKAKALFDTGYESNKIVILQSVILLTFWGGGPNNYWNFYSWIGTGVTIAETLGIHRSLAGTNMSAQDRSLLRRLWWVLVIRDASSSSLVGRPFRINMNHSDTEMLTPEDFEHDSGSLEFAKHPLRLAFGLYQIHMSKLSMILREIVTTRFDPRRKTHTTAKLDEMLQDWRQHLPPELRWSENSTNLNVFAATLAIVYNHHLILAHLGQPSASATTALGGCGIPEAAAQQISAVACSIVTRSRVLLMPHETFQGLFLAQVVFYTQMKSSHPIMAQLGRTALDGCQMVLHDAREAWDPAPWVMNLFNNLIRNLKEDSPNKESDLLADPFGADCWSADSTVRGAGGEGYHGDGEYDSWQANPMISSLFDTSYESNSLEGPEYNMFQPSV